MSENPSLVPCPLRSAALASPRAPAIIGDRGRISYAGLDARVSAAENRLREMGFSVGDRVALYLPKGPDYVVLLLALIRAGIVACPVSTRLPPGGVAPLLRGAGCYDLISDTEALIGATDSGTKNLGTKDLIDDSPGAPPEPASPRDVPLDRPSTIVFTSGSTGTPKAALHTFGNHYFNALGSNENIALAPGDRWLHSLPLYHVGGLSILFRCLLAGATVALPEPGVGLGESVSKLGVTHVSLVSTQLRRLLDEGTVPSGLKAVLMGGGPIPPSLVDESLARGGLPIHTSYGLTEMASQVTSTPPGASRGELRTAGRSLPYREVRVSEDGEILVRGPTLFAGYLEGEIPKLPLDEEGWFHTGDLGEMDAGGRLAIVGRRDNMFVSGGENVQPEEIEAALCRIEGVEEAVVVPVPDPEFGARPVAFVRKGGRVGDLAQKLKKALPGFKIPKAFHNWEGSGGMKPDRASLARRARPARDAETEP